jgi:alpha-1,6-mannosyltransferase
VSIRRRLKIHHPLVPLLLLAGLLLAGEIGGLIAQYHEDPVTFVFTALFQGAVWVAAARIKRGLNQRPALMVVIATAALLRLLALTAPVFLSDDINRYIWDGRVAAAGINPYRYIPTDPELVPLRDESVFPYINRNNYAPTIYPPVAQMLFLATNRLGGTVLSVKLVFVLIEAVGIGALFIILRIAGLPRERVLLYAWHPLPVWEIAGSGHVDAAMVALVAIALAAALIGRRVWSGAALAAATLVKFFPVVLVPAMWRPTKANLGDWRWITAYLAVIIAAYLPYIDVGWRVLGFLPGYVIEENLAAGAGFWLLDLLRRVAPVPLLAYIAVAVVIVGSLTIGALHRGPDRTASLRWAALLATATTVLASPHYPWYFVWLVALLTVAPWWPAWWLTVTAVLLYCDTKAGHVPLWEGFVLYGGFALLLAVEVAWRGLISARSGVRHGIKRAS